MPVVLMCLLLLCFPCFSVQALEPADLIGAWYAIPPASGEPFPNDHYRYELFACTDAGQERIEMYTASIYPDRDTRTLLRSGYGKAERTPAGFLISFLGEKSALGRLHRSPQGFPVRTYLDMKGEKTDPATRSFTIGSGGSREKVRTLTIDGTEYRNLADDLYRYAVTEAGPSGAGEFVKLLFLQIFLIQARIPGFGTAAMIGKDVTMPFLDDGTTRLKYKPRGVLGLVNSGVLFMIRDGSDLPGIIAEGDIFGGLQSMEGILEVYGETSGVRQLLGTVDFNKVRLKDGVISDGTYGVSFAVDTETHYPVPVDVVGK